MANVGRMRALGADPPLLRFDQSGKVVKAFGEGLFVQPHGMTVDRQGNVWVTDAQTKDGKGQQVFKFSPEGKLLMTLGKAGVAGDGTDVFSGPSDVVIGSNGDIFVADGHINGTAVGRIMKFSKDGTFIKEFRVTPETLQNGSVWDLVLSEDKAQRYIFLADGANGQIVTLLRENGEVITAWGRHGRQPGQFKWVHNIAVDSKGNLYTAEVGFGRRAQKFRRVQ